MGHIDPTKEVFAQFRANDRPGPIHMLNLVRLRAQAAYPDGRKATGAEAYAAYGRESGPVFERLGGKIVWQGRFELMLIGPAGRALGSLLHRRISVSVAAFAEMIRDPVYREAVKHRQAGGRGFPPDPARGAAGRQDVWRDSEVGHFVASSSRGLDPAIHRSDRSSGLKTWIARGKPWRMTTKTNRRPRGTADRFHQ